MSGAEEQAPTVATATARGELRGFAWLFLQLAVIVTPLLITSDTIWKQCTVLAIAWTVHYFAPVRFKEPLWVASCLAALVVLLGPVTVGALVALMILVYAIAASPQPYWARVAQVAVVGAGVVIVATRFREALPFLPYGTYRVVGVLFAFRTFLYFYEIKDAPGRPSLREFAAYFVFFPLWGHLLIPIVDFKRQRDGFLVRPQRVIAQEGMRWVAVGVIQLMVYRMFLDDPIVDLHLPDPEHAQGVVQILAMLAMLYAQYLLISASHHICVGMMHLFGYAMPPAHRNYALARSPIDLWRRVNIYWKDFLHTLVYLPTFFRLRKVGVFPAQVLAMLVVFFMSWIGHIWLYAWDADLVWSDVPPTLIWHEGLFWLIFGVLCTVQMVLEERQRLRNKARKGKPPPPPLWRRALVPLQVVAMFLLVGSLWLMLFSPSLAIWWETLTRF